MSDGAVLHRAELPLGGAMLTARRWASPLPETPHPGFQMVCGDSVMEGQAVDPPEALPDGRVMYRVKVAPAPEGA